MNKNNYVEIDMENWCRREHYKYYTESLKIEIHSTSQLDISRLLEFCHAKGCKFYPTIIYLVTKTLNRIDNFKMFINPEGKLSVWDKIIPNYTIFHNDDKTFSDCWTEFEYDFKKFYDKITADMDKYKHTKGIKAREGQPSNFYCISCVPWVSFTAFNSRVTNGEPAFFPIITIGKYENANDKTLLPINITIAHAVCDGYHIGLFFEYLKEEIDILVKQ